MNKKTILISAVIIVSLAGLFLWGRSNPAASPLSDKKTSLTAQETLYDFGTISMARGLVNHVFTVTNPTDQDMEIKTITTSCMCTVAYLEGPSGKKGPFGMAGMGYVPPANEVIKAGESRAIKVVYDPNAHGPAGVGPIDRYVRLVDQKGEALSLEIKAIVTP